MPRTDAELLAGLLSLGDRDFLVRYGRPGGSDLDVFAVIGDRGVWAWDAAGLDIFCLGRIELQERTAVLDPRVTEPLVTGEFLAGSEETFREARDHLLSTQPSRSAALALWWEGASLLRSLMMRTSRSASTSGEAHFRLLTDMSFAQSLLLLARAYGSQSSAPRGLLRLAELEERSELLRRIRSTLRTCKRGQLPDDELITALMRELENAWLSL